MVKRYNRHGRFARAFAHSIAPHSFIRWLTHSFVDCLIRRLIHSSIRASTDSLIDSVNGESTVSLIDSSADSFAYFCVHSLTHWMIRQWFVNRGLIRGLAGWVVRLNRWLADRFTHIPSIRRFADRRVDDPIDWFIHTSIRWPSHSSADSLIDS